MYVGSAIIEPAAWPGTVRPWYLLIWIFLVSIVFQGSRALNNDKDRRRIERYDPLKPDYWRWVEYALTSPFQVFLIATSVMIGERSQLLSLMGLQGALVMIGFANGSGLTSSTSARLRSLVNRIMICLKVKKNHLHKMETSATASAPRTR